MPIGSPRSQYLAQHQILSEKYLELKSQKFSDQAICSVLGLSKMSLLRWKSRNGFLKPRPHKLTKMTIEDYLTMRASSFSDREICQIMDVDVKTLYLWRSKNRMPIRKHYPPTPKALPEICLKDMERLYPLLDKISNADVKSLAVDRLIRSVWIFYCKDAEGYPLTTEFQKRYFSRVIGYCIKSVMADRRDVRELFH